MPEMATTKYTTTHAEIETTKVYSHAIAANIRFKIKREASSL